MALKGEDAPLNALLDPLILFKKYAETKSGLWKYPSGEKMRRGALRDNVG